MYITVHAQLNQEWETPFKSQRDAHWGGHSEWGTLMLLRSFILQVFWCKGRALATADVPH
jgi:hypothetical protein